MASETWWRSFFPFSGFFDGEGGFLVLFGILTCGFRNFIISLFNFNLKPYKTPSGFRGLGGILPSIVSYKESCRISSS